MDLFHIRGLFFRGKKRVKSMFCGPFQFAVDLFSRQIFCGGVLQNRQNPPGYGPVRPNYSTESTRAIQFTVYSCSG